ncbi:CAP domain-containing protein [Kiritimatiellota bacterium B12222]|nr:CAP domain-containing protein [Kiritimatiellota bacterium B12222]
MKSLIHSSSALLICSGFFFLLQMPVRAQQWGTALPPPTEKPSPYTGKIVQPLTSSVTTRASEATTTAPFDIHNRQDTRSWFTTEYTASENIAIGWTGSHSPPQPGTTSQSYRNAIIRRINLFRAFAGVPNNISENATYSAKCQEAALMMSVNNKLSHAPTPSEFPAYYTDDGAEAAGKSNLYLGENGPSAIDGYIQDPGSNNLAVGHRNWILDPPRAEMGSGDVSSTSGKSKANILWVIGNTQADPEIRDAFVAWPPAGYVPSSLLYKRWSFKKAGLDLSEATVEMSDAWGNTIALNIVNQPGSGDSWTPLVWEPDLLYSTANSPRIPPEEDEVYHVVITVPIAGVPSSFQYTIVAFDPSIPKAELTGTVFFDLNQNGSPDPGEEIPHTPVIATGPEGEVRTFSRSDGCYSLALESTGTYTLSHPHFQSEMPISVVASTLDHASPANLPLTFTPTRLSGKTVSNQPLQAERVRMQGGDGFTAKELVIYQEGILSRIENAETGLEDLYAIVPNGESLNDLLDSNTAIDTRSFHFSHAEATSRGMVLSDIQPSSQSVLRFLSQLTLSTSHQIATVEVQLVEDGTWTSLWTQAGNGSAESSFSLKEIDLSPYANTTIQLRFWYQLDFGSYYPQSTVGWFVDNIEITHDYAQGTGYVEIDRRDISTSSSSFFTPEEEGLFRYQIEHHQSNNSFLGGGFDLEVNSALDPTPRIFLSYEASASGTLQMDLRTENFIPYTVELSSTDDLTQAFSPATAHEIIERDPHSYQSEIPQNEISDQHFFRFSAEP